MHELVKRAATEGEKFWREMGIDYNSDEDEDYIESDVEEDVVDSDFDAPESDEDECHGKKKRSRNAKEKRAKKVKKVEKPKEKGAVKVVDGEKDDKSIFQIIKSKESDDGQEVADKNNSKN